MERRHLASAPGGTGTKALSTHFLVLLMELASRNVIENLLPDSKMTVGTLIRIRHFGNVPLGAKIRAVSVLREIDGRRLVFDVVAFDEYGKVAEGQNEQLIVSQDRFLERIGKKKNRTITT